MVKARGALLLGALKEFRERKRVIVPPKLFDELAMERVKADDLKVLRDFHKEWRYLNHLMGILDIPDQQERQVQIQLEFIRSRLPWLLPDIDELHETVRLLFDHLSAEESATIPLDSQTAEDFLMAFVRPPATATVSDEPSGVYRRVIHSSVVLRQQYIRALDSIIEVDRIAHPTLGALGRATRESWLRSLTDASSLGESSSQSPVPSPKTDPLQTRAKAPWAGSFQLKDIKPVSRVSGLVPRGESLGTDDLSDLDDESQYDTSQYGVGSVIRLRNNTTGEVEEFEVLEAPAVFHRNNWITHAKRVKVAGERLSEEDEVALKWRVKSDGLTDSTDINVEIRFSEQVEHPHLLSGVGYKAKNRDVLVMKWINEKKREYRVEEHLGWLAKELMAYDNSDYLNEGLRLMIQVVDALEYLHREKHIILKYYITALIQNNGDVILVDFDQYYKAKAHKVPPLGRTTFAPHLYDLFVRLGDTAHQFLESELEDVKAKWRSGEIKTFGQLKSRLEELQTMLEEDEGAGVAPETSSLGTRQSQSPRGSGKSLGELQDSRLMTQDSSSTTSLRAAGEAISADEIAALATLPRNDKASLNSALASVTNKRILIDFEDLARDYYNGNFDEDRMLETVFAAQNTGEDAKVLLYNLDVTHGLGKFFERLKAKNLVTESGSLDQAIERHLSDFHGEIVHYSMEGSSFDADTLRKELMEQGFGENEVFLLVHHGRGSGTLAVGLIELEEGRLLKDQLPEYLNYDNQRRIFVVDATLTATWQELYRASLVFEKAA